MFNLARLVLVIACWSVAVGVSAQGTSKYPGVGREATQKEVAAWDIDVRPDFKGLPAGSGSVAKGQRVWEEKCSSCHGIFGESGEVFSPLVGGTTAADIKSGRVANLLTQAAYPGRSTLMKVPTLSTLWDYINRAMPWTAPKSLSTEEVYAVTAFMLNLGGVLPGDYVLTDKNIAEVQQRMPNRNGMTTQHALWPGQEFGEAQVKPDTGNTACMKNCISSVKVVSSIPDHARDAHGNLAEQNRLVGAQRGVDTTRSESKLVQATLSLDLAVSSTPSAAPSQVGEPKVNVLRSDRKAALNLVEKHSCTACHGMDKKIVGPSFLDIRKKYRGQADYLANKIKFGGGGVWGSIPMPVQSLSEAEARILADWLAFGTMK